MVAAALWAALAGLAVRPARAATDPWAEGVLWPLARYAQDLAEGDGRRSIGVLDADAAMNIVMKAAVEPRPDSADVLVHNVSSRTVSVPYASVLAAKPAEAARLRAVLAAHRAEARLPFDAGVADWLAEKSAALRLAAERTSPDGAARPAAVVADWSFFGFRRAGVEDLPSIGTRARAQTLKMLRALAPQDRTDPADAAPARETLRRLWLRAQESATPTQYMLTGSQARAAVLDLYPRLESWAAGRPAPDGSYPWRVLLGLAEREQRPYERGRPGALWVSLDANAARTLAEAAALLRRRSWPAPAAAPAPKPAAVGGGRYFEDVTSTANFVGPSSDALDVLTIGAACLDADGDGRPDLFLGGGRSHGGELWSNRGGMRFENVPAFAPAPLGERAVPVDFDDDGWTDLLVLGDPGSPTRLLRNLQGKGFEDVTDAVGLDAPLGLVETGLWFDADGDGTLDLLLVYLGRFVDRDVPDPQGTNGPGDVLFLQKKGRFVEATAGSGLEDKHWGWAAAALDYDGDGREDVFLCNIWGRSRLFHNDGGGRFSDVTSTAGIDVPTLCKGVSVADVNGDGLPDLFVDTLAPPQELWRSWSGGPPRTLVAPLSFSAGHFPFADPGHERLYVNDGHGHFTERAEALGATGTGFGFSGLLYDLDLDGRPDLFVPNGFYPDTLFFHDERKVLKLFDPAAGRFVDASAGGGADFLGTSRGVLAGDLDGDGCPDLVVTGLHGARLLRGDCPARNGWLKLRLSQPAPNIEAVGARVEVEAGGRRVVAWAGRQGGGKILSGCGGLEVGLGRAARADSVVVSWPGGPREVFGPFAAGTATTLRRGAGRRP